MQSKLSIKKKLVNIFCLFLALVEWGKAEDACKDSTSYDLDQAGTSCRYSHYIVYNDIGSHQYASDKCTTHNSLLTPIFQDFTNFVSILDHFRMCQSGQFHSAFAYDSRKNELKLGEKVISQTQYTWMNNPQPTSGQSCIKAAVSPSRDIVLSQVDCNEQLMFSCVVDSCYQNNCESHQTCVRADKACNYTCQDSTTTKEPIVTTDRPGETSTISRDETSPVPEEHQSSAGPQEPPPTTTNRPGETSTISQDESSPVPEKQRSTIGPPGENHTLVVILVVVLVTFIIVVIMLCIVCRNTDACRQIPVRFRGLCNGNRRAKPSSPYQVQA